MAPSSNKDSKQVLAAGAAVVVALGLGKLAYDALTKKRPGSYVLKSSFMEIHISSLGGIIQKWLVKDGAGKWTDIVLGYDKISQYPKASTYFGAVCGRVANRITKGKFIVDGTHVLVSANDGENHCHGGFQGWDKATWEGRKFQHAEGEAVELTHTSPDGDEGYPGTVQAKVTYTLVGEKKLKVDFQAETDKATPINIVQHSYFNLGGHKNGTVLGHNLQINATHYTPKVNNNEGTLPTGEIKPVKGTPFDFTQPKRIGQKFFEIDGGYDHNFVLHGKGEDVAETKDARGPEKPEFAAELSDPLTGISLRLSTTAPGVQVYAAGFVNKEKGKDKAVYPQFAGICLETQAFPDAVNHSNFPSTIVKPGELYRHEMVYELDAK